MIAFLYLMQGNNHKWVESCFNLLLLMISSEQKAKKKSLNVETMKVHL